MYDQTDEDTDLSDLQPGEAPPLEDTPEGKALLHLLEKVPTEEWLKRDNYNFIMSFREDNFAWLQVMFWGGKRKFPVYQLDQIARDLRNKAVKAHLNGTSRPFSKVDPALNGMGWRALLDLSPRRVPYQYPVNIGLILANHEAWQGKLWWDEVRELAMVNDVPLSDKIVTEIAQWLGLHEKMGVSNLSMIERCIVAECQNTPRDLPQEWLASLDPWDGTPRLETWLTACAGTETTSYGKHVSSSIPISLVARALQPGCLYRHVVILEGPEEMKKSTLVRALVGSEWTVELSIGLESKEAHMMLRGAWVAELPELDSVSRTEDPRLKAFFTMSKDSYIPKYSNNRVDHARRTIFIGTTNETNYLKGQTGNTRYLPIATTHAVDVEAFLRDRDQIFAEALQFVIAHHTDWWHVSFAAEAEAIERREERRVNSLYEQDLEDWLENRRFDAEAVAAIERYNNNFENVTKRILPVRDQTSWRELCTEYLQMENPERWAGASTRELKAALKAIGYEQAFEKIGGKTVRVYKKA